MPQFLKSATIFPVQDKKPLVQWSLLAPGEQIRSTRADHALATGERSGVVVIDVDDLTAELPGEVPKTFARKTPRGGLHIFFVAPEGVSIPSLTNFPVDGVDIRGDGGYVVYEAPGYEDLNEYPLAELPDWFFAKLLERGASRLEARPLYTVPLETEFGQRMLAAAEHAAKTLDVGGDGSRDEHLWAAAVRLVRVMGMPVDTAIDLLLEHYEPRVEDEGKETVNAERIEYKCKSAAVRGLLDFEPLVCADFSRWVATSLPMLEAERREKYNLLDPSDVPDAASLASDISSRGVPKLKARDMIPSPQLSKISFPELCNILATHDTWAGRIAYDTFAEEYLVIDPPIEMGHHGFFTEEDVSAMRLWLASQLAITAGAKDVFDAMNKVARDNEVHTLRDYLHALPEVDDAEEILQDFAVAGLGATTKLEATCIKKFMISAVRRALHPGVKADSVLLLQGPQGLGKSSLLYALSPDRRWVQESLPDLEHKDSQEALRGRWLVEIAELQALFRKNENAVKDFLSRQEDSYRRPYGRGTVRMPRQCVFVGTTNEDEILRDHTGGRRYWVVRTESIDLEWVRTNRDVIWAAAYRLALKSDEIHYLDEQESKALSEAQKDLEVRDPWEEMVAQYLESRKSVASLGEVYLYALHSGTAVLSETSKKDVMRGFDMKLQWRLGSILRRLGWKKVKNAKGLRWVTPLEEKTETSTQPPSGALTSAPESS